MTVALDQASLTCDAFGACRVIEVQGDEAMNALPSWKVHVLSDDPAIDLDALLGAPATLGIRDPTGTGRASSLMIRAAEYVGSGRDGHWYDLHLTANLWLLTKRRGFRVFLDKSAHECIVAVLEEASVDASTVHWRLGEKLHVRPQCVQYDESEWAFITRLLADEGINHWFETDEDGVSQWILGDATEAHEAIAEPAAVPYRDPSAMQPDLATFYDLERSLQMTSEAVHVRDYDERTPEVWIEGRAGEGALERFEYPAWVPTADNATRRASVRLEQWQRFRETATGTANCARLQPGRVVTIAGAADDIFDGHFLVVRVVHELAEPAPEDPNGTPYRCRTTMVPVGDRVHRPAAPTAVPRVKGIETAQVTGPAGEEIHVDDLGSIKIRHPWDRSGVTDDNSSRWVRTMQVNMGMSMMLPRMQWEVPVAYRDGRADQPLCLGKVYNAVQDVPYELPAFKARASIGTATTPHDGTKNEEQTSDDAGSMESKNVASGHQRVAVGGNSTIDCGVDEVHQVDGNIAQQVVGSQGVSAATQTVSVASARTVKVAGARTVTVGSETLGTLNNRVVDVGGNCLEVIGGAYGLQCNKSAIKVKATFIQAVGAAKGVAAALGLSELIAAGRVEAVGGSRLISCKGFAVKTGGLHRIGSGSTTWTTGANMATQGISVGITAGATSYKGAKMVIKGTEISVTCATLMAVAGSALSSAGAHGASSDIVTDASTSTHAGSTKAGT